MHKTLTLLTFAAFSGILPGQTTIDLGNQARNVDFSNSGWTKTFKTGTALPYSCSQGETYLKLDAPAGQNIYACTSMNVWIPQGGESTHTSVFEWTRATPTEASISGGAFRFGSKVTTLTVPATLTLHGGTTGTIWVSAAAAGSVVIGHNLGAGNLTVSGDGFVIDALATKLPDESLPLYQCQVTSGFLPVSCTDLRAPLSSTSFAAGDSGALSVDCNSGSNCIIDILPGIVPALGGENSFTGLNTFSHIKLPSGGAPDPQHCTSPADTGRAWVQSLGTPGRQLYICEGETGWRAQGDVDLSTNANIGHIASLPISSALAAQAPVAAADQVRLVLTTVPNRVRLARLATWVASTFAGGRVRLGIYRTDGTLVAQTDDLDTGTPEVREGSFAPVTLDPGFYYFAWSLDNTTALLAGAETTMMTGLFNRVAASPGQATCDESMTATGLPPVCTILGLQDNASFPVIAIAGFAQ